MTFGIFGKITMIWGRFRHRFGKNVWRDTAGMGTVEIIIIIAVLVTLALIFRGFIMELADGIFDKIQEKTDSAISEL